MCGMNPEDIYKPPESLYEFFRYPELPQVNKPGCEDNPAGAVSSTKKAKFYYILAEDREFILEELKVFGMDDYYFFPELEKEIDVVKASVGKNTENGIVSAQRGEWKERKNKTLKDNFCHQPVGCPYMPKN